MTAGLARMASSLVASVCAASASGAPLPSDLHFPSPVPSATATAASTSIPGSDIDAQQQLAGEVRAAIDAGLADTLLTQVQLEKSLRQNGLGQEALEAAIQDNRQELSRLDADLASPAARIKETQRRVNTERRQIRRLARAFYRQPDNLLVPFLEAGTLRLALMQGADLTVQARRGQALQGALQADLARLGRLRGEQQAEHRRRQELAGRQAVDLRELQRLQGDQQRLGRELAGLVAAARDQLVKIDEQHSNLVQRITRQLEAEEAQLAAAGIAVAPRHQANDAASPPAGPGHSTHSRFIWPLPEAVVTQVFGPTDLWLEPPFAGLAHFHTGIDIAEPLGSQVLAADDGVVAEVSSGDSGYGNYVVLAHEGGLTTLYGHLEQTLVAPGDHVQQGQPIGLEGSTGLSTGPHCHFEVRMNGQPVDPAPYLPPGPPSPTRE